MMIKNSILNKIKKIESVYKPPDDKPVLIVYIKEFHEIMSRSNSTEKEVLQAIKDNPNVFVITGGNENE